MSFNDEIDQVEGLLSRIGDGFLEMRTSLQHIHELNASLDEISVGCDKEKNALMQEMLAKGDSRASQSQLDTLRSLEQRLHNLQRLEALPHWEWQHAQRRLYIQEHMEKQRRRIRQQVDKMYRLTAAIRYKTIETMEMLEPPTEEELRTEELVQSARRNKWRRRSFRGSRNHSARGHRFRG
ncbi:hypothetical protein PpBr36_03945 [Pyricularia pennisetigena]|uniref:hypothetical protein n=1 Tax=Pyricularia pennisetigena TaxID=1578925 RepID=UPI0011511721|nr:hypothetical protein PpBr36_03945 [Pyricularia pennisetigena]TLS29943.1 hypothetical protein PpBr36_03945 [Pyricularia pennisetigena]